MFEPPWTPAAELVGALKRDGEAVLAPASLGVLGVSAAELDPLKKPYAVVETNDAA